MKWFDGDDLAVVGVIVIAIASLLFLKDATQIVLVCVGGLVGVITGSKTKKPDEQSPPGPTQ